MAPLNHRLGRDERRPQGPRINQRIRAPEIRLIGADGAQLGCMAPHVALRIAEQAGLDLVEISPRAEPPVCKIMDYGKFKFEQAKKKQPAKQSTTKEMKFRPKTEEHDLDFKVKHIQRFLSEGNKVRLVVQFRGREIVHPEVGRQVLDRVVAAVAEVAVVEMSSRMEDRRMVLILAPKAKN